MAGTRLFEQKNSDIFTDVTFEVQGTDIRAHRLVIISGGGGLGKFLGENTGERVEIKEEVAPETFEVVLEFIYTDACDVNDENLFQVTHAAKVFGLDQLERYCADVVKDKLEVSNVLAFACHAVELDARENVKVCQEYFRTNTSQVIGMKEFLEISYDVLLTFCSSHGIACSELDLFKACVEWAKRECQRKCRELASENLRDALGDVLSKIKFSAMKKTEFEDEVLPLDILTHEEIGRLVEERRKIEDHETVQVTVIDHRKCLFPKFKDSRLTLPLSTRIKHLKEMKMFDVCTKKFSADKFILAHKETILRNEDTLASIYTPGEQLVIKVHSFDIHVHDVSNKWDFTLAINPADLSNIDRIILSAVYARKGIFPDKAQIDHRPPKLSETFRTVKPCHLFPDSTIHIKTLQ